MKVEVLVVLLIAIFINVNSFVSRCLLAHDKVSSLIVDISSVGIVIACIEI